LIEISDSDEEKENSDNECEVIALPSSSEDEETETESTARGTETLEQEKERDPHEDGQEVKENRELDQLENEKIKSNDILNVSPSQAQLEEIDIPLQAENPTTSQEEDPEENQSVIEWGASYEDYKRFFSDNYIWYLVERLSGGKKTLEIHVKYLITKKLERLDLPSEYVKRIHQYMEEEGLVEQD
jgi:hypothetical protein